MNLNKFTFEITIEAQGELDAELKLRAASVLIQKLRLAELTKLAEIVKNDPVKTAMARRALGF